MREWLCKKSRFIAYWYDFTDNMKAHYLSAYAGGAAFFLFLSLIPMVAMVCAILPYTPLTEEFLIETVVHVIPEMFSSLVTRMITQVFDSSAGVLTISILITVWTASKGIVGILMGLNSVNDTAEKRNFVLVRLVSCLYMLIMFVVIILSLVLMVFGRAILNELGSHFPAILDLYGYLVKPRYLYLFVILTLFFAFVYAYMPNVKLKYREQLPGAMIAALGWLVFSFGFSLYVSHSGSFTIYGSLAMIIVVMLWLYFCMYLLFLGAYLNVSRYTRPILLCLVYINREKRLKALGEVLDMEFPAHMQKPLIDPDDWGSGE